MYFRIIVKNGGFFMFRTSKINTQQALGQALSMLEAGFIAANEAGQEFTAEVLQAYAEGSWPAGKILNQPELAKLLAEDDSVGQNVGGFDPIAATGTAAIAAAIAGGASPDVHPGLTD